MENEGALRTDLYKTGERPYRSHLQPACLECRKRKARCVTTTDSDACLHCQLRRVECIFPRSIQQTTGRRTPAAETRQKNKTTNRRLSRGRQQTQSVEVDRVEAELALSKDGKAPSHAGDLQTAREVPQQCFDATTGILDAAEDESPHVVGPALVDDNNDELDDNLLLGRKRSERLICLSSNSRYSHRGQRPVMFTTVRRRPLGLVTNQSVAASKCEIIEKLVGPGVRDLVDV